MCQAPRATDRPSLSISLDVPGWTGKDNYNQGVPGLLQPLTREGDILQVTQLYTESHSPLNRK